MRPARERQYDKPSYELILRILRENYNDDQLTEEQRSNAGRLIWILTSAVKEHSDENGNTVMTMQWFERTYHDLNTQLILACGRMYDTLNSQRQN